MWTYFDLVTWRFMLLSVHSRLKAPVASNHVLIKLFRNIQVRHTYQVTAVLEHERQMRKGKLMK